MKERVCALPDGRGCHSPRPAAESLPESLWAAVRRAVLKDPQLPCPWRWSANFVSPKWRLCGPGLSAVVAAVLTWMGAPRGGSWLARGLMQTAQRACDE